MLGNIINDSFNNRRLLIYIPPSYNEKNKLFPVFYIHDGGDLFDPDISNNIEELENMFRCNYLEEVILIGIASSNRTEEYTPWFADNLFGNNTIEKSGKGFEYLSFIIKILKPYLCEKYKINPNPLYSGIIGASFGGLISMYAAFKFPNEFSMIGSISGSYWYPNFIDFMKNESIKSPYIKIYMDVGSEEGKGKYDEKKYMVKRNIEAFEILKQKDIKKENILFHIEDGSNHGQKYFIKRFNLVLKYLLSYKFIK